MNTIEKQLEQLKASFVSQIDVLKNSVEEPEPCEISVEENPAVTCVCPTYGRFTRLRTAVACFLFQTYRPRSLLIVNDGPRPIKLTWSGKKRLTGDGWEIILRNIPDGYDTLGEKRTAMAEATETPLIAHWDDDDIYLPWHIEQMVEAQRKSGAMVVAQWPSFDGCWEGDKLVITPVSHKPHDSGWLFVRDWVLKTGGYKKDDWGESVVLMKKAHEQGKFYAHNPQFCGPGISLIKQRGDDGLLHMIDCKGDKKVWEKENKVFPQEQLLPGVDLEGFSAEEWAENRVRALFTLLENRMTKDHGTVELEPPGKKVLCIGFQKTGTSSLTLALGMLGWDAYPSFWMGRRVLEDSEVKKHAEEILKYYNAVADNPWSVLWEWLAETYPEAKFILTERDVPSWKKSVERHFGDVWTPGHEYIYGEGRYIGHEDLWENVYTTHNENVKRWFQKNRPEDFLVLNICNGEGWEKLCDFLGKEKPGVAFPHCKQKATVMDHLNHCAELAQAPENEDSEAVKEYKERMERRSCD